MPVCDSLHVPEPTAASGISNCLRMDTESMVRSSQIHLLSPVVVKATCSRIRPNTVKPWRSHRCHCWQCRKSGRYEVNDVVARTGMLPL